MWNVVAASGDGEVEKAAAGSGGSVPANRKECLESTSLPVNYLCRDATLQLISNV